MDPAPAAPTAPSVAPAAPAVPGTAEDQLDPEAAAPPTTASSADPTNPATPAAPAPEVSPAQEGTRNESAAPEPSVTTVAGPTTAPAPALVDHTTVGKAVADPSPHQPVDPVRIQAQVARAMLAGGNPRGGDQTITLQLDPEHLGKVEVRLVTSGDRLEVVFTAENVEAQQALREGAKGLMQTLGGRFEGRWQHVDVKIADPSGSQRSSDDNETDPEDQDQSQSRDDRRDQQQRRRRRQHEG